MELWLKSLLSLNSRCESELGMTSEVSLGHMAGVWRLQVLIRRQVRFRRRNGIGTGHSYTSRTQVWESASHSCHRGVKHKILRGKQKLWCTTWALYQYPQFDKILFWCKIILHTNCILSTLKRSVLQCCMLAGHCFCYITKVTDISNLLAC